jgi:hypothetical protein
MLSLEMLRCGIRRIGNVKQSFFSLVAKIAAPPRLLLLEIVANFD